MTDEITSAMSRGPVTSSMGGRHRVGLAGMGINQPSLVVKAERFQNFLMSPSNYSH